MIKANLEIVQDNLRNSIVNAYYSAALQRSKKLPKLQELLNKIDTRKKPMTVKTMFEKIKAMNKALGGD